MFYIYIIHERGTQKAIVHIREYWTGQNTQKGGGSNMLKAENRSKLS